MMSLSSGMLSEGGLILNCQLTGSCIFCFLLASWWQTQSRYNLTEFLTGMFRCWLPSHFGSVVFSCINTWPFQHLPQEHLGVETHPGNKGKQIDYIYACVFYFCTQGRLLCCSHQKFLTKHITFKITWCPASILWGKINMTQFFCQSRGNGLDPTSWHKWSDHSPHCCSVSCGFLSTCFCQLPAYPFPEIKGRPLHFVEELVGSDPMCS